MAQELNSNGFTDHNGNSYKVDTNVNGGFVSDFSRAFILSIKDKPAIEFLKEIGLLNNGRCPLTGLMILPETKTTFTSEDNSEITYDISTIWYENFKVKRNWGCLASIMIFLFGIVWGLINGFNAIAYITVGTGSLLAILSIMHTNAKFGNNWNRLCLSNDLGINTITLFHILKIEESKEGMCSKMTVKYGIPSADLNAYMRWKGYGK